MASDHTGTSGPAEPPVGDYNDTLQRLKSRLGEMRAAVADPYEKLGLPSHPAADIARFARLCHRAAPDDIPDEVPEALPGPATINVLAERLGFEVIWEAVSPSQLQAVDLPAVVILRNRTSRLLMGRPDRDTFQLLGPDGTHAVEAAILDKLASGTVFRIREREAVLTPAILSEATSGPAAPRPVLAIAPPMAGTQSSAGMGAPVAPAVGLRTLLASALEGQKTRILHLCVASLLINLFGMALPLFSMAVFDRVIPHAAIETLWALALGVILALALEMLLRHARLKLFDAVGQASSFSLQGRLVSRLLFARAPEVPRNAGSVIPAMHELDQSAVLAPQLLVSIAVDLPFFVLLMVFIASIGGPVVLAPLIGTVLLVLVHCVAHALAQRSHMGQVAESRKQMQQVVDAVAGTERIRATNAGETMLSRWEFTADRAGHAAHLGRYWHGLAAQSGAVLVQLVVVATVVMGAFRVQEAAMTIGALSAAILLVNRAMMPVSILTGLLFRAMQLGQSLGQAAPLMNAGLERAGDSAGAPIRKIEGKIDLHRVSFAYPGETKIALREISLSIGPGERVGIIGKAGCGKSSLLRLLARLNEPTDGRILVDERDIRQYDPHSLRAGVGLMPQDLALFDTTLHENLTIGLGPVEQAHFERVTRMTGVADFAGSHPSGYGLATGQGGQRLSGGERQAVALARALMGKPRLLLLDEPTSAMDNGAEQKLIGELKKYDVGKTGLVIATHRLQVLALVDRVIWLDQGRIVADGPKDQVFAKLGVAA